MRKKIFFFHRKNLKKNIIKDKNFGLSKLCHYSRIKKYIYYLLNNINLNVNKISEK